MGNVYKMHSNNSENNWIALWQETTAFDNVMLVNMKVFIHRLNKYLNININDKILDIGCGPGHLESCLSNKVDSIHGIDISERYITLNNVRFKGGKCKFFQLDPHNYLNLDIIKGNSYTKVIALSVIQYYRSIDEIKALIQAIRPMMESGGKMIIADIVVEDRKMDDILDLFKSCLLKFKLISFIKFLIYARFSSYYKMRKNTHLLIIPIDRIVSLLNELGLKSEIVDNLTIHKSRKNLLIYF
jgi:2-polyprenyl-3-methyl-5-hydroxy-6-metoxy-1,4-benzoquinol methylase